MKKLLTLASLLLAFASVAISQTGETLFESTQVHTIEITFPQNDFWTTLTSNYENAIDPFTGVPTNVPYLMGSVTIDGNPVDSIGLRQKGFSSHFSSNDNKKSLKLKLNEFVPGQRYEGVKKFNLSNGVGDPALQRDVLCYELMRRRGVNAPRTSYAEVYLNGTYWGLYLIVEQVDKTFVSDNFLSGNGNLYKNIAWSDLEWLGSDFNDYLGSIELKTNETENDWSGFINFLDVLHNTSDADFPDAIAEVFDVDYYLRTLAVDVITDNWDSYIDHGRNYYLYQEPVSELFYWIPWDYNLAMGGDFGAGGGGGGNPNPDSCATILSGACPYPPTDTIFQAVIAQDAFCCETDWDGLCQQAYDDIAAGGGGGGGGGGGNPAYNFPLIIDNPDKALMTRIWDVPSFREKYLNYCCQLMEHDFVPDTLFPVIDFNGALIDSSVQADVNYNWSYAQFQADLATTSNGSVPSLKEFITNRIPTVNTSFTDLGFDCGLETANLSWNDVVINEFMALNDSLGGVSGGLGDYDDWIELYNNTNQPVDLSYYYLSDRFNNHIKWSFPYGSVIGANSFLIVWADGEAQQAGFHANFRLNSDGDELLLSHLDGTLIDSVSFGLQTVNMSSARVPNGTGNFIVQPATYNYDNNNVGIEELAHVNYSVYPNPANSYVAVDFSAANAATTVQLSLVNMLGQEVLLHRASASYGQHRFDVSGLNRGVYVLRVQADGATAQQTRVVIR